MILSFVELNFNPSFDMLVSWGKHKEGKQHPLGDWFKKTALYVPPSPYLSSCLFLPVLNAPWGLLSTQPFLWY
jgi:hypothetical protein